MTVADINWGSVADWVSGLGSLSAGIIALYLARASQRIRLKGYCCLRMIVGFGTTPQEIVSVVVTNIGTRSTVINNISMRVGRFRKKRFAIITVVKDQYSVGIPYALADGQEAHWGIPMDQSRSWIKKLCDGFVQTADDVKTLQFRVHTSHGDDLFLRPEEPLRKAILEALEKKAN